MLEILTLGSDPEFVLLSNKTGRPVSAVGLNRSNKNLQLFADNVLAEVTHTPFTPSEFTQGMKWVLSTVTKELSTFKGGCHYVLGQCSAQYPEEELTSEKAHEIGCEPFLSAYRMGSIVVPSPYTSNNRFAGGHIHIGYEKSKLPPHMLVKLLDKELLQLDPNHEKTLRSAFYGAAGSFRDKSYGIEYRAVSNWWLTNPEIVTDVLKDITNYVNKKYYKV